MQKYDIIYVPLLSILHSIRKALQTLHIEVGIHYPCTKSSLGINYG